MPTVKEKVYDKKIDPLVEKIIKICQDNKMALLLTINLGTDENGFKQCTSALLDDEYDPPEAMIRAFQEIY